MLVHSYPLLLSLYKGEGRILIVPLIDHIAGYSIDTDWYENISDTENTSIVGNGVLHAVDYIRYGRKFKDAQVICLGVFSL